MNEESKSGSASHSPRAKLVPLLALGLFVLFSLNALAFNWYLQPEEIDDAYYLGQTSNHEERTDFLKKYQHNLAYPSDKPFAFVQYVEFQTPYAQIVLKSQQRVDYSKFQAAEDYRANPRLVVIRVVASLTNGYTGPEPPAGDFKVVVSQEKPIEPQRVASKLLCNTYDISAYSTIGNCMAYTREIDLNFDAKQFTHGSARIKISLPGDHSQQTTFDLDELK